MKQRISLGVMVLLMFALLLAAPPEATHAEAPPEVYQYQYRGVGAYANWDSCPNLSEVEPGDVCSVGLVAVSEYQSNDSQDRGWKEFPWLYMLEYEYTVDEAGYLQFISYTSGSSQLPSYDFDKLLRGVTAEATLPVVRCSNDGTCTEDQVVVRGAWTGVGEREHGTYTYNDNNDYFRVTAHATGWSRNAVAEIAIDGESLTGIAFGLLTDTAHGSFQVIYH